MKRKIVTAMPVGTSKTAPEVLRAVIFRLPVFNTLGCNMEIRGIGSRAVFGALPNKSGACAPSAHQACLAGSGPEDGLTLFLAVTHRKAFLTTLFVRNAFVFGRDC